MKILDVATMLKTAIKGTTEVVLLNMNFSQILVDMDRVLSYKVQTLDVKCGIQHPTPCAYHR